MPGMAQRKLGAVLHKKNVNSQRHHPLLSGLPHPGGAHTSGLRLGKDGNNTTGRMISGQTRAIDGSSSWSTKLAQGNLSGILQENIHDTIRDLWLPSRNLFFVASSRPVRRNWLNATERCTQNTLPGTCHSTFFLVSTHCALRGSRWCCVRVIHSHPARAFSSCVFDVVAQRQVHSVPVAPLFTQCLLIQGFNATSGPHKKLVSISRRTRSLEGVWPPGRFRSKQR